MNIVLRYFDARGRAQFLRHYFACRAISYVDDRIPLSADFHEWASIRDDRSITGPFRRLPVLVVNGVQIAETPVIATDAHERFGDSATLSAEANRRHSMLLSSLYVDLMLPLGQLIWADRFFPGVDLPAHLKFLLQRLHAYLATLDEALCDWNWVPDLGKREVMLADCLLWEELDTLQAILGGAVALGNFNALAEFYEACPGRTVFEQCLAERPCQITGRPGEAAAIAQIHESLADTR